MKSADFRKLMAARRNVSPKDKQTYWGPRKLRKAAYAVRGCVYVMCDGRDELPTH